MSNSTSTVCCLLVGLMGVAGIARADETLPLPSRDDVLDGLRDGHPRLLATSADFARLRSLCETNTQAGEWLETLHQNAEKLIETPPLVYRIPDGKRLLTVCRAAKERVLLLALMYRLTEDSRFADRAWRELSTVCQFKDWNPSHFLDTAEMTFAVAIGYDWLYDVWSEEQRAELRKAINALGLQPGLSVYRPKRSWSRSVHNWNQVCNGGMGVGALAIADEDPTLAAEVLESALHSLPLAMHEFRPDGGWGEGPGYWRYATEYNVYFLAALRTALGSDFGLSRMSGFPQTGDFPTYFTGPTGLTFNYADAHDGWSGAPQLFWLASTFDEPGYAAAQLPYAAERPSPLDLLWGADWLARPLESRPLPLDRYFSGVSVVTLCSAWDDPRAVFAGIKGGDNRVNHGQLDLGSFVLDAERIRWAIDLGPDDYNIPGYFGGQRWTYYRNKTEGHNTLVVNGQNQSPTAVAEVRRFATAGDTAGAVIDLSDAYPDVGRAWRGLALIDRQHVIVRDELESADSVTVRWHLHTPADVEVDGRRAVLTHGDQRLYAEILAPATARFEVETAHTDPPQKPLKGVRRLTAATRTPLQELTLIVLLTPDQQGWRGSSLVSTPLSDWPNELVDEDSTGQ